MTQSLADHVEAIARHLSALGKIGDLNGRLSKKDELRFGQHGSLHVTIAGDKRGLWKDFETGEGGNTWQLLQIKGALSKEQIPEWPKRQLGIKLGDNQKQIVATYDYLDETGKLLYQVVRYDPKDFLQRRPDGAGSWVWSLEGVRRVLYRLPELVALRKAINGHPPRVYIPEGEKDVDRLVQWRLSATCNAGGAAVGERQKKRLPEFAKFFAGLDVVILPDNDASGREHALTVARELLPLAHSIKIVKLSGIPEGGDISDWIDAGGTQSDFEALVDLTEPFSVPPTGIEPVLHIDLGEWDFGAVEIVAAELPPRGWLLGNWLCRQFVSSLIGAGATGKTAVRIACALSLASGRSAILGEHVFERVPVLYLCFEDGELELKRRICAAMLHHCITNADIRGYLFVRAITNAELKLVVTGQYKEIQSGPLAAALDVAIVRRQAGAVFLDPLIKIHTADENNNMAMDLVATALADLAIRRDVAVDIPGHVHKGRIDPGNADNGRGAGAVKDAGRLGYTICGMSTAEAEAYQLDHAERRHWIRIDPAKVNISPGFDATKWLRLVGVPLGNTWDPRYPHGDSVQTVEPWLPPDAFDGLSKPVIADIFTALRAGPGDGEFYSADPRATHKAVDIITRCTGKSTEAAQRILSAWLNSGALKTSQYYSPKRKKQAPRIAVNEIKAAEILGPLYRPPKMNGDGT